MVLKEFDLTQFDGSEADNMFDGFCAQHWGYHLDVVSGRGLLSELGLTVSS